MTATRPGTPRKSALTYAGRLAARCAGTTLARTDATTSRFPSASAMILDQSQQRLATAIQANAARLELPTPTVAAIIGRARDHLGAHSADPRSAALTCGWLAEDCAALSPPELRYAAAVMAEARNHDPKAQLVMLAA